MISWLPLFLGFNIFIMLAFAGASNPLSMGLFLLVQTISVCVLTGLSSLTFWFSYVLFLVFFGGVMILFIYVASLAPNKVYSGSYWALSGAVGVAGGTALAALGDSGQLGLYGGLTLVEPFMGVASPLYSGYGGASATGYMIVYLLYTLFVVVYVTSVGGGGALRSLHS